MRTCMKETIRTNWYSRTSNKNVRKSWGKVPNPIKNRNKCLSRNRKCLVVNKKSRYARDFFDYRDPGPKSAQAWAHQQQWEMSETPRNWRIHPDLPLLRAKPQSESGTASDFWSYGGYPMKNSAASNGFKRVSRRTILVAEAVLRSSERNPAKFKGRHLKVERPTRSLSSYRRHT